jgi:hypothetical protein
VKGRAPVARSNCSGDTACRSRGSRAEQTLNDFARFTGMMNVQQALTELDQHEHLANAALATMRSLAPHFARGHHPPSLPQDLWGVPVTRHVDGPLSVNVGHQSLAMQDPSGGHGLLAQPHLQTPGEASEIRDSNPSSHAVNEVQDQGQSVQHAAHHAPDRIPPHALADLFVDEQPVLEDEDPRAVAETLDWFEEITGESNTSE